MPDSATLIALSERCEAASGPDRELDGAIALALSEPQRFFNDHDMSFLDVDGPAYYHDGGTWGGYGRLWKAPAYTASLDAALALVKRAMPGAFGSVGYGDWSDNAIAVTLDYRGAEKLVRTSASTPALALVAATLRALAASTTGERDAGTE